MISAARRYVFFFVDMVSQELNVAYSFHIVSALETDCSGTADSFLFAFYNIWYWTGDLLRVSYVTFHPVQRI